MTIGHNISHPLPFARKKSMPAVKIHLPGFGVVGYSFTHTHTHTFSPPLFTREYTEYKVKRQTGKFYFRLFSGLRPSLHYSFKKHIRIMLHKTVMISCGLLCCALTSFARQTERGNIPEASHRDTINTIPTGWYAGLHSGLPFGVSTFSSLSHGHLQAGWNVGIQVGYRFNSVFSLELQGDAGRMSLQQRGCCAEAKYWLGTDGVRYNAPVAGLEGWDYSQLESHVLFHRYGFRFNVNLLGLFERTRQGHWSLEISPLLSVTGTRPTIENLYDGNNVLEHGTDWHLNAGGNLQAGYQMTKHLSLGIYSGASYLTGKHMDGLPEHLHKANFVWESGIRISWAFGKKRNPRLQKSSDGKLPPCIISVEDSTSVQQADTLRAKAKPVSGNATDSVQIIPRQPESDDIAPVGLPVIYFSFNSVWIEPSERTKVEKIARTMRENPDLKIHVTGYADHRGSQGANLRVSLMRANAVKERLMERYGIDAGRIMTTGGGTDMHTIICKARRAQAETAGAENHKQAEQKGGKP